MSLDTDIRDILRAELGEGFERTPLAKLQLAYLKRQLLPKLKVLYASRVDNSGLEAARQAVEDTVRNEQATRKDAIKTSDEQAEADIEGLT